MDNTAKKGPKHAAEGLLDDTHTAKSDLMPVTSLKVGTVAPGKQSCRIDFRGAATEIC